MAQAKQRIEHHFAEDGTPEGIVTTVEKVPYLGYQDGKPAYGLNSLEFWQSACITTWVLIILYVVFTVFHH